MSKEILAEAKKLNDAQAPKEEETITSLVKKMATNLVKKTATEYMSLNLVIQ